MIPPIPAVLDFFIHGPLIAQIVGVLLLLGAIAALWAGIRYLRDRPLEDTLTVVAASIATGVSAQGMWKFTGDILGFDGALQWLLFAFIEVAIIISALRARRNMRESAERAKTNTWETPSAGADGIAVWVLTVLTAILSSLDARSVAEAVFRLAAPLVAAWLWERGMAVERKRITGLSSIHWRLTPERVLVRFGLAEARDRSASEVDVHRRLTRVARAYVRVTELTEAGAFAWRITRAQAKGRRKLEKAEEHTDLATNPATQATLLDKITTLRGGTHLAGLPSTPPWQHLDHPAITRQARHSEALALAAALDRNTAARLRNGSRPVADDDRSATADATTPATGRPLNGDHPAGATELPPPSPEGRSWMARFGTWSRPETRPVAELLSDRGETPEPVAEVVAEPVADEGVDAGVVATDPRPVADRKRPDEQDRKRAVRFYINHAKKLKPPSKRTLAEWTGFSETWSLSCIQEGRQTMIEQGWTFDENGAPTAPRPVAEVVATTPAPATADGGAG